MREENYSSVAASVAAGFSPRSLKKGEDNPLAPFAKGEEKGRSFARKIFFLVLGVLIIGTSVLLAEIYFQEQTDLKDLPPITRETVKDSCLGPIKTARAAANPGWYGYCNSGAESFCPLSCTANTICSNLGLTAKRQVVCGYWNQNPDTGVPETFTDTRSFACLTCGIAAPNASYPCSFACGELTSPKNDWASRWALEFKEWGEKTGGICSKTFSERGWYYTTGDRCHELASCYVWCE